MEILSFYGYLQTKCLLWLIYEPLWGPITFTRSMMKFMFTDAPPPRFTIGTDICPAASLEQLLMWPLVQVISKWHSHHSLAASLSYAQWMDTIYTITTDSTFGQGLRLWMWGCHPPEPCSSQRTHSPPLPTVWQVVMALSHPSQDSMKPCLCLDQTGASWPQPNSF